MDSVFHPPKIFNAVRRPRLFRLLDDNAYKKNCLVVGQAAQGKSTLVASYIETQDQPVLWIQLTARDDKSSKLYEKLVQGLTSIDTTGIATEDIPVPRSTLGAQKDNLRLSEAITTIFRNLSKSVILILDDLQAVDEASQGFSQIRHLLDLNLEHLRIILLSRTLPGFDLANLKMRQRLFILDNEDLAFTIEETRNFFGQSTFDHSIDIDKIYEMTQGWAGGLTLVSETIRQLKDVSHLPDHLSADVFSFFSQEIYNRLDAPIRDFLMKASILETIEIDAANHVTGNSNAMAILTGLEKRNLFIQRIHSQSSLVRFKFHDLFRRFLTADCKTILGKKGVITLNRKAGQYFWDNKDHEQAVHYFLKAQSFPSIIRIIQIKGIDYLIKGKLSEPEQWLKQVPDDLIVNDPWLLFFTAMTQRIRGGKQNIRHLEKALALFEEEGSHRGILLCTAFLIEAAVFIRLPASKVLYWIRKGEKVLGKIGSSHRYPWARAMLWQQIGLGYIAGDGNIPRGLSACKNAILLARQIQNPELMVNASITMTFGYVQAGDFVRAREILTDIEHMTIRDLHPEYRALKGIVDIDLALKHADFNTAKQLLESSEKDIETFGLIFLYPGYVEEKAYYLVFTSQYNEARQMADHLNDFSILEGNDFYSGISNRINAVADLYSQNYSSGLARIEKSLKQLKMAKKGDIHHFQAIQIQGTLQFLAKLFEPARQSLESALDYFKNISSELSASETAVALGLTAWELGDKGRARHFLNQGFEKICRYQYTFFPNLTDQMLCRAIVLVTSFEQVKTIDNHLLVIISQIQRTESFAQIEQVLQEFKKREKTKLKETLRPLYKYLLPKIKISTLGRFTVKCDDNPLDPILFEGSRPALLLKSIVLHDARDIPKEILIEDLWPETDAKSGEKNFKINLHRLRKIIEPDPDKEFGYSYVQQKSGLVSLDTDLVVIDTQIFMTLINKGLTSEREKNLEAAVEYMEKAVQLYQGDYFAEEAYVEWIYRKRDLYRTRFLEILQKKAYLHEELDQPGRAIETWRQVLQTEPGLEKAYQNLMILYADTGEKRLALGVFDQCKTFLYKELGAKPGNQTQRIYQKIQSM